jgi:hypothetical protein
MWQVEPALLSVGPGALSVTGIESMLGCPLKWTLRYKAGLRRASVADIPPLQRLAGQLGHRLIEELHKRSSGADGGTLDASVAPEILDRLIATEGAVLLRPGRSFERAQLRRDLLRAVARLAHFLAESGFQVVAVEQGVSATWECLEVTGRTDLLLRRSGEELIVDLKWGRSRYRKLLESGHAVQLGTYAFMRASANAGDWPATGYYSLSRSDLLSTNSGLAPSVRTIPGASPREVWDRTSSSLKAVRRLLEAGRIPVTGLRRSLPLLEVAGVEDPGEHLKLPGDAACEYCDYEALCGRAWQGFGDGEA